jgi:tetratricopeptide (TPR) repeat protein
MKNLITYLYLIAFTWAGSILYAQENEAPLAYQAYLKSSPTLWKAAVNEQQQTFAQNASMENRYQLALAQVGLLNSTMIKMDEDLFDHYLDQTEDNLEELTEHRTYRGEAKALLASVYGLKMAYSPWKGIYLGSKSSSLLKEARQEAPNSPLVWKLYANSKLFTPETFGGSSQEAQKAYEKSVSLWERDSQTTAQNWWYLDTLAWLGQTYQKNGEPDQATAAYTKALATEPEFTWVKQGLLPKLSQR